MEQVLEIISTIPREYVTFIMGVLIVITVGLALMKFIKLALTGIFLVIAFLCLSLFISEVNVDATVGDYSINIENSIIHLESSAGNKIDINIDTVDSIKIDRQNDIDGDGVNDIVLIIDNKKNIKIPSGIADTIEIYAKRKGIDIESTE